MSRNRFALAGAAVLLVIGIGTGVISWVLSPADTSATPIEVTVPSGSGTSAISRILERNGIVRHWAAFSVYAAVTGREHDLQAGTYLLCACQSVPDIVAAIAGGAALSDDVSVTIPEGMNVWEIDALLAERKLIQPGSFARQFVEAEGTLFPDTYRFPAETASVAHDFGDARVIGAVLADEFAERAKDVSREQLIIASMLEKEAKSKEDMALVAGIIAKRRSIGMLLQIDATVAYGWCLRRWMPTSSLGLCDVTQAPIANEITVDGPYNTYTRKGLPAGPISNPGEQALWAAAYPTTSDYLYYLSTRDGSRIIFSKTLEEHNRNRATYLGR